MTTPTPEQIAKWREEALSEWEKQSFATWTSAGKADNYALGYIRARTEQATEIAALKAQLAELMPLAKVGALVARKHIAADGGKLIFPAFDSSLTEQLYEEVFTPNIHATIEKLLKD